MPETTSQKPRVAVIGLGSMGFGMATSLSRAGFGVTGCDVSADAVARFVAGGGGGAETRARGPGGRGWAGEAFGSQRPALSRRTDLRWRAALGTGRTDHSRFRKRCCF